MNKTHFISLAILIFLAPVFYSGKSPNALFFLEVAGLWLLWVTMTWKWHDIHLSNREKLFVLLIVLIPWIYLIPIHLELWKSLAGRDSYLTTITWLSEQQVTSQHLSLSIIPIKTLHAALAILPAIAVFLSISSLSKAQIKVFVYVIFATAAIQATIGLVQASNPKAEWLEALALPFSHGNAQGTYLNRDHFSILMVTMLPLVTAIIIHSVQTRTHHEHLLRDVTLFGCLFLLFTLAAIFSRSRAGVGLVLLALLLNSIFFIRHIGLNKAMILMGSLTAIMGTIAISIGIIPILNRFIVQDPSEDGRWQIFETTIIGIKQFFPIGSGPSTFPEIYRTLQPIEQKGFINHAHNDYLELVFELGILGVILIIMGLLLYIGAWSRQWGKTWNTERFIQTGAGLSLFLMALHSILEFNLHTPANAILFASLAALFLRNETSLSGCKSRET